MKKRELNLKDRALSAAVLSLALLFGAFGVSAAELPPVPAAVSENVAAAADGSLAALPADYRNWKQTDPRWRGVSLGRSSLGRSGCYVTAVAMLLVKSGVERERYRNGMFDPGVFATELREAGAVSGGNFDLYDVEKAEPAFRVAEDLSGSDLKDLDRTALASLIRSRLDDGGYVFVVAHNPTTGNSHAVAVADANESEVTILDPGYTTKTGELFTDYPSVRRIVVFTAADCGAAEDKTGTAEPEEAAEPAETDEFPCEALFPGAETLSAAENSAFPGL